MPTTWNNGMLETGNPRPCPANSGGRGGTEHREAGAKNIGLLPHLVEKYHNPWDLPAIAFETLSSIWALLFFSEVHNITITSTGVAGG